MSTLSNQKIKNSFQYLIQLPASLSGTVVGLQTGTGEALPISISTSTVKFTSVIDLGESTVIGPIKSPLNSNLLIQAGNGNPANTGTLNGGNVNIKAGNGVSSGFFMGMPGSINFLAPHNSSVIGYINSEGSAFFKEFNGVDESFKLFHTGSFTRLSSSLGKLELYSVTNAKAIFDGDNSSFFGTYKFFNYNTDGPKLNIQEYNLGQPQTGSVFQILDDSNNPRVVISSDAIDTGLDKRYLGFKPNLIEYRIGTNEASGEFVFKKSDGGVLRIGCETNNVKINTNNKISLNAYYSGTLQDGVVVESQASGVAKTTINGDFSLSTVNTPNRIPYISAGGLVTSNAGLSYNSVTGTLAAQNLIPVTGNLRLGTGTSAGVQIGTGSIGTGSDAPVLVAGMNPFGFGLTVMRGDNLAPTDLYARYLFSRDGLFVWNGSHYTFRNDSGRTRIGSAGVPSDDGVSSLQVAGAATITGNMTVRQPGGTPGTNEIRLLDNNTTFSTVQAGSSALTLGVGVGGVLADWLQINQNSTWVFRQSGQTRATLLNGSFWVRTDNAYGWGVSPATNDTELTRSSAGFVGIGSPTNKVVVGHDGAFGRVSTVSGGMIISPWNSQLWFGGNGSAGMRNSLEFALADNGSLNWTVFEGNFYSAPIDTRIRRSSANTLDLDTGTNGAFGNLRLRNLTMSGTLTFSGGGNANFALGGNGGTFGVVFSANNTRTVGQHLTGLLLADASQISWFDAASSAGFSGTTNLGLSHSGNTLTVNQGAYGSGLGNLVAGNLTLGNGAENSPSLNLGDPTTGFWRASSQSIGVTHQGTASNVFFSDQQRLRSTNRFGWASGSAVLTTIDTELTRSSAGFVGIGSPTNKVVVGHDGTDGSVTSPLGTLRLLGTAGNGAVVGSVTANDNLAVGGGGVVMGTAINNLTFGSTGDIRAGGFAAFTITNPTLRWPNNTPDTRIRRSSANTLDLDTGTDGAFCDLRLRNLTASGATIVTGTATLDATLGYGNVRLSGGTNPRIILDGGTTGQVTQLDNNSGTFRILSASSALVTVSSTGNLTASGTITASGLTSGRALFAGTGGVLTGSAQITTNAANELQVGIIGSDGGLRIGTQVGANLVNSVKLSSVGGGDLLIGGSSINMFGVWVRSSTAGSGAGVDGVNYRGGGNLLGLHDGGQIMAVFTRRGCEVNPNGQMMNNASWDAIFSINRQAALTAPVSLAFLGESSTTARRSVSVIDSVWVDNADATRAGRLTLGAYSTTTPQEGIRVDANSGGVRLGFYGATAVARQTVAADATDLASALALINDLKAKLIALGLVA